MINSKANTHASIIPNPADMAGHFQEFVSLFITASVAKQGIYNNENTIRDNATAGLKSGSSDKT